MLKPDRTTVSLSRKNYNLLKKLGNTGESFNDVISRLFEQLKLEDHITK